MFPMLNLRYALFYAEKVIGFMLFVFVLDCIISLFRRDFK